MHFLCHFFNIFFNRFYICCDKCQDWFHGRCVGIVQSEADLIDEYICPNCEKNHIASLANVKLLSNEEYDELKNLTKVILVRKNSQHYFCLI